MHITNELYNNCANHKILRNHILQKLVQITQYTQTLPKYHAVITQINDAIYADITQALRRHYAGITQIHYTKYTKILQILRNNFYAFITQHYANITQTLRK